MDSKLIIANQRIAALKDGIRKAGNLVSIIDKMIRDCETIDSENTNDMRNEIDQIQAFLDWLAAQ